MLLAPVVLAMAVLAGGCGGSTATPQSTTASAPSASSAAAPAAASSSSPAASALAGKWAGQYSGAYHGTFHLHWRQTGSSLAGKIRISALGGTVGLHGTINGNSISFGTVGHGTAITYTGTVSGDSMSGTYSVNGARSGHWSAAKDS